jgi:RNA polymerase sigma factor (sigma-70 family)
MLNDASALLAEHGGKLHALLYRLTLRSDVAEDLLQDLFCKLAVSDGFRRAENRTAFAFRAAMNLAFDWRRSRKRITTADVDVGIQHSPVTSPLSDLVRREELEQTLSAIGELQTLHRDIVVFRYLEQQSYEAIAEQLGKTAHQVRAIAHKAIEQLRSLLGAKSEVVEEPQ